MEIDSVQLDSEGTAPWDSSSASTRRDRSPSETKIPQPKENTEKAITKTRSQLRDCLDNVHDGRFATSGALPNAANPGIFVQGVGPVGLPLSSHDAEAIIDTVHTERVQAKQGKKPLLKLLKRQQELWASKTKPRTSRPS